MSLVSRGFRGRSRIPAEEEDRVPPGQQITNDFPVLSAGLHADPQLAARLGRLLRPGECRDAGGDRLASQPASLRVRLRAPTSVEAVAGNLIGLGYPPEQIKAERFGGT